MSAASGIRIDVDGHMTYSGPQHGKPLRVYAPARECQHPDCSQRLNRYNPGPYCHQHERTDDA